MRVRHWPTRTSVGEAQLSPSTLPQVGACDSAGPSTVTVSGELVADRSDRAQVLPNAERIAVVDRFDVVTVTEQTASAGGDRTVRANIIVH